VVYVQCLHWTAIVALDNQPTMGATLVLFHNEMNTR
jgi:hypothetical protein